MRRLFFSSSKSLLVTRSREDVASRSVPVTLDLIIYAFGSELWVSWSEELGRRSITQLSLFIVRCDSLPHFLLAFVTHVIVSTCAQRSTSDISRPPSRPIRLACALRAPSTACGSVTLRMIADMFVRISSCSVLSSNRRSHVRLSFAIAGTTLMSSPIFPLFSLQLRCEVMSTDIASRTRVQGRRVHLLLLGRRLIPQP